MSNEIWKSVLTSAIKSGNEVKRGKGPLHCTSAKEVDAAKYLSDYWDRPGYIRESILSGLFHK